MSTRLMADCWGLQMSPAQKSVLISLADNANDEGYCWPSLEKISERTCLSRRAVINAISWLESVGLLRAIRDNGRHTRYVVTPQSFDPTVNKAAEIGVGSKPLSKKKAANDGCEPVHQVHGCSKCTGAPDAPDPCTSCTGPVHQMHTNRKEPSITVKSARETKTNRAAPVTFSGWLTSLPKGEDAIPADDPVFDYAEDVGIPMEMLALVWEWFKREYSDSRSAKRYTNWRQVFRNAVKGNWAKVWWIDADGSFVLTTEGKMLQRQVDAQAMREAA